MQVGQGPELVVDRGPPDRWCGSVASAATSTAAVSPAPATVRTSGRASVGTAVRASVGPPRRPAVVVVTAGGAVGGPAVGPGGGPAVRRPVGSLDARRRPAALVGAHDEGEHHQDEDDGDQLAHGAHLDAPGSVAPGHGYGHRVRPPLTEDDLDATEGHREPEAHRELADTLLGWAGEPHPDDEVSTAALLAQAGWHLDLAGDTEAALDVFRRSQAAGTVEPDVRCSMVAVLLASGRADEARTVAEEFRRTRPGPAECAAMAEVYETADDLDQAARWTAIGLNRLEMTVDDELDDWESEYLLRTRARIRAAQGLPLD